MEKVKLKITTLTPVAIGSGEEWSPYADYVLDDNKVYFIDKKKMVERIMAKGEKLLNDYVYGVASGIDQSMTKSNFDLKNFLLGNQIVKDIKEITSSECRIEGNPKSKLPIKGMIKSPLGEPYFPGSSIKGALKTVLMYNWLQANPKAETTIENVINNGNFNWLEKEFEYKEDNFSGKVIRKNTLQQVTDSNFLLTSDNIIVDCYRAMPIRLECIAKNQTAEFELTLSEYKWTDLAKQANQYAEDVLNREFDLIDNQDNLDAYYNFLVDIEDGIIKSPDDTAYFRIGFGKGYYLNSLGIAIYDYVSQEGKETLFDKFEDFINKEYARKDKFGNRIEINLDEFPKTRLFVTSTQEPLGWIKVERQQ